LELAGLPSVVVSGATAVERLVTHLVERHRVRAVLFLEGRPSHPESLERRAACEATSLRLLDRPALVTTGNFSSQGGYRATLEALDQGLDFDAIVAANDHMALGALNALRERGFARVRAVTGFDDLNLARVCHPPLTTVAQPFREMAFATLRSLVAQLEGTEVPLCTQLSSELMLRQSCGCPEPGHEATAAIESADPTERFAQSRQNPEAAAAAGGRPSEPLLSRLPGALA